MIILTQELQMGNTYQGMYLMADHISMKVKAI